FSFRSEESENKSRGLWVVVVGWLVMLVVMGIVAVMEGRGMFTVVWMAMFMMRLIRWSVEYFKEK
ncbi:hypothetical protein, partial [Bacillus sp. WP8]|uniref:hypothetical protein n=1 Tax=Bacillus sp. WP8 TaxID=756828 RepID=UPI001C92C838